MTGQGTVIVGAGILGCLAAQELSARMPAMQVTLLDRDLAGSGATRRSAGLHLPRGGTSRLREMAAYSHAYYADMKRQYPQLPMLPVAVTVHATDAQIGCYLPEAAPQPMTSTTWRLTGGHYCDVYQLTQTLVARLRDRVTVTEGVSVTGLEPCDDGVVLSVSTGQRWTASRVILAPGPWLAAPAWRDLVAPLGLRVKRIVALHIAQRPGPADTAVVFDDEDAFLLPLTHRGHWLFSYTCRDWDVDPDAPPAGLTKAHLDAARTCLRRHRPELAQNIQGGRVCCDAYSPDGAPVVAPLAGGGRIIFAGAASGSGYRLAPAIAAEAATAVQDMEGADSDPQQLRHGRATPLVRH
jgi:glycine/D-amino acid oxidase-like deaminating enzyme